MKKIFFVLLCFLFLPKIQALGIVTQEKIPGVYANQTFAGKKDWAPLTYIKINGVVGYCVEPGVKLSSTSYQETLDFRKYQISEEDQKYLELVAYYGYQYPGHQNHYYYMATQELIWRRIISDNVVFTTKPRYQGDVIDVTTYKEEILRLIQLHHQKPSFDGQVVWKKNLDSVFVHDQNNVLEHFTVIKGDSIISGNDLEVFGMEPVHLKRIYHGTSYLYLSPGSQRIVTLELNDEVESFLEVEEEKYDLKIIKKDFDTKETIKEAIFRIKKEDGTFIKENDSEFLKTNNGILILKDLEQGNYFIEEIEAPYGYLIDTSIHEVFIDGSSKIVEIDNKKIEMPKTGRNYQTNSNFFLSFLLVVTCYEIRKILSYFSSL